MKPRLTIFGLMSIVAFAAVGMAAVRHNDDAWTGALFGLTVGALCTASLIAIYRRGAWAGFAVFGWAQFLICQPHSAPAVGITPPTIDMACRLLAYLDAPRLAPAPSFRIPGYPIITSDPDGRPLMSTLSRGSLRLYPYLPVHSLRALLCLSSVVSGYLGAVVGGLVAHRFGSPSSGRPRAGPDS
jgi:hypothetical protein